MKRNLLLLSSLFCFASLFSQSWVEKMQKTDGNYYNIKTDFENYWAHHDNTEKGKGYKVFKRWENFVERRVYPSGDLSQLNLTAKNFEAFLNHYQTEHPAELGKGLGGGNNMIASATFTPMGPFGAMSGNAGGQLLKSGRINFITVDPTNSNNLWVGAPAGGLWKSTNGGTSWTTNTDNLTVIGCSDLAIDPGNTSIMYLATGDGDAGDTRSIGVLKSIDGGLTWTTTGLTFAVTANYVIRRLIINPSNSQIIIAATNGGIWRTSNGGTSWTLVSSGTTYDLEFKPGNSSIVYAAGTTLKLSNDAGVTYTVVSAGIPTVGINRMAIAVTANDANYVYVLASSSSNSGFQGFYRSVNSAGTFSLMASTPNLLGWATAGNDAGGQGWYDLCVAASPLNKDEVVTGGVNVWRTVNGGSTWALYGHWVGSGAPFTHADQHDLDYDAAGTLFNTNDGTVYKRVGATWTEISGTMNISQIYKLGLSTLTANKWISGHQDNGTSIWTGASYNAALGGDGMDCFIDRTNDLNMFGEYQNGALRRSTNGGLSWNSAVSGLTGSAPWVTVWKQDPTVANTLYVGYVDLFKSTNLAVTWGTLAPIPSAGGIREFAIAPSNNQIIYVLKNGGIFKTINGGASWANVTGTVPVGSALPEFITIDPTDANNAWVVLSGYSAGNKVFMTTNGGTTWTNYTANLPNIPANCCIYQPATNDRIYVGMDVGIYYRDNASANWTLYNLGLPNVPISDFEISPASPTLLHAATYGRGVWVASLFSTAPTPVSGFTVTSAPKCQNTSILFTDQSTNAPNAWNWSVTPSAGVVINSPTLQNPTIIFPNGGNYTVTVVASNTVGAGSVYNQLVNITGLPNITIANSSQAVCVGSPVTYTASGATSYTWTNSGGNSPFATFYPTLPSTYTVYGSLGGCSSATVCSVILNPLPVINISGQNAICQGASVVLLANGASTYTWNTFATTPIITVSPTVSTVYNVTGTSGSGCNGVASKFITVNPLPNVQISGPNSVCLNQSAVLNATGAFSYTWSTNSFANVITVAPVFATTYTLSGMDANGCLNTTSHLITVDPIPTISLLTNNLIVCFQDQVSISALGAVQYTWMPGALNGSTITYTANSSISYTCLGEGANGCTNSNAITVNATECINIKEAFKESEDLFAVFPNPTNGKLSIEMKNKNVSDFQIQIYDATGKELLQQDVKLASGETKANIDISHFSQGVYFIRLQHEDKKALMKIIKENN